VKQPARVESYDHEEPTSIGNVVLTNGANGMQIKPIPVIDAVPDDDDSIPHEIPHDEPERRRPRTGGPMPIPGRDDSGLRMIGSLGRDRAEASGELAPLGDARGRRNETARELVTILPRRSTREMPIMTAELAASLPTPTPTPPVLAPKPVPVPAVEAPKGPAPAPPPASPPVPQAPQAPRVSLPGSGVRAPDLPRRLLRLRSSDGKGLGLGALLLVLVAAVLAGTAVLMHMRGGAPATPPAGPVEDAAHPSALPVGSGAAVPAAPEASGPPGAAIDAGRPSAPPGAAASADLGLPAADAGPRSADAGSQGDTGSAGGGTDKIKEAKALYDKAHDALEESDFARAFELADASLKLRKTARTYLLRAQAEQRLERVDAALASVDAAAQMAPDFSAVWEMRGRILWAARRHDEARAAFEKFLALDPNSPKAASVQKLMNEPR
jgi:hypothetical protein